MKGSTWGARQGGLWSLSVPIGPHAACPLVGGWRGRWTFPPLWSGEGTFFTFAWVPVPVSCTNPSPGHPYTSQNARSLSPLLPQDTTLAEAKSFCKTAERSAFPGKVTARKDKEVEETVSSWSEAPVVRKNGPEGSRARVRVL